MRNSGYIWSLQQSRRPRASGSLVLPDSANLRLFLFADDIDGANNTTLTDGVTFGSWTNKGTLGGTMTQGTPANQPTYRASQGPGGKPAADFDGGDTMVSSLAASNFTYLHDGVAATTYTVVRTAVSGIHTIMCTASGAGGQIGAGFRYNTTFASGFFMQDGISLRYNSNPVSTVFADSYSLSSTRLASVDTPALSMRVNDVSTATATQPAYTSANPTATARIGTNLAGGFGLVGQVYLIASYGAAHDAATVTAVMAAIQAHIGATFPV